MTILPMSFGHAALAFVLQTQPVAYEQLGQRHPQSHCEISTGVELRVALTRQGYETLLGAWDFKKETLRHDRLFDIFDGDGRGRFLLREHSPSFKVRHMAKRDAIVSESASSPEEKLQVQRTDERATWRHRTLSVSIAVTTQWEKPLEPTQRSKALALATATDGFFDAAEQGNNPWPWARQADEALAGLPSCGRDTLPFSGALVPASENHKQRKRVDFMTAAGRSLKVQVGTTSRRNGQGRWQEEFEVEADIEAELDEAQRQSAARDFAEILADAGLHHAHVSQTQADPFAFARKALSRSDDE